MAFHAEYPLRRSRITKVLNLLPAVTAPEAACTEGVVARENGQVLNFVSACAAAVCAVVTNEGAIAEQEEICIGVEQCPARIAAEAVNVPPVSSCVRVSWWFDCLLFDVQSSPSSNAFPSSRIYVGTADVSHEEPNVRPSGYEMRATFPQRLHGYATSSSMGDSG